MREFTYVVYSNPVAGREDEYNRWYSEQHLAEVMAVPGFVSARRFRVLNPDAEGAPRQTYMALYDMRTDEPDRVVETLRELVESGRIMMSEAISQDDLATILYEAITPVVTAPATVA